MIKVEKLTYGFPAKDLYKDVSFTLEMGQHCALIGSNGTGKSTLADMLIDPEEYLYDGKITRDEDCRIGFAGQFSVRDKDQDCTVFEYLSRRFIENQQEIAAVCDEMAKADDVEALFEKYQTLLDMHEAMDGDNYESNIRKSLYLAGLTDIEEVSLSLVSGGEYKILQIMKEMLLAPNLLILDEPDVFLDFGNLSGLCRLINGYKGTMLVITHNRYLLDHCFDKIMQLEGCDIQEYEGSYTEYRCQQLKEKLMRRIQYIAEQDEIERNERVAEELRLRATLMMNPVIGRSVNARQSRVEHLRGRQIKAPFIEVREPEIALPDVVAEGDRIVLSIKDYQVAFDKDLLENVSFDLKSGEKAAIVGANGTGKTTLIRDIMKGEDPAIHIGEETKFACLSQLEGETLDEDKTVGEVLDAAGFQTKDSVKECLEKYCLDEDCIDQRVRQLSGGEQNLLQIALMENSEAELLIMDEPTSHLDVCAQDALETALEEYKGAVLMVSHDFNLISNCADYVLFVEDGTVRRMRTRTFRKMVYEKYFEVEYLETDRKRQELEMGIAQAMKTDDMAAAVKLWEQLEKLC